MGAGMFWGILLILLGVSLIFKVVFNFDIPFFRIIIAFLFFFIGLKILFGNWGVFKFEKGDNDILFCEATIHSEELNKKEYNIIFAKGVFDLRNLDLEQEKVNKRVKISTVFGGTIIKVNKDLPLQIEADAVFSGAKLPDGNTAAFGNSHYMSPTYNPNFPSLQLKIDVVFGGVDIQEY